MPDSADKYYIFSLTLNRDGGNYGRLYYSVVNKNLNGGLGDIEPGRKGLLLDSMCTELMTATLGDRCNIWLGVNNGAPGHHLAVPVLRSIGYRYQSCAGAFGFRYPRIAVGQLWNDGYIT